MAYGSDRDPIAMLNKEAVESEVNGPGEMDIRTLGSTRPINCASGVISGAQSTVPTPDRLVFPDGGTCCSFWFRAIVTIMVPSRRTTAQFCLADVLSAGKVGE
jgi:hypothetical protein